MRFLILSKVDVVIPAAGQGIRFHELGMQYPKCILPYKEKPIIVHNLSKLLKIENLGKITIIVGHQSQKIINTVGMYFPEEVNDGTIIFNHYKEFKGNTGPLVSIYQGIINQANSILIILSDIFLHGNLSFEESFVSAKKVEDFERWCMVKEKTKLVFYDKVERKPPTNLALSGIYYFKNGEKFFQVVEGIIKNQTLKEYQISQAIEQYQLSDPVILKSVSIIDFGTLEEYEENRLERNSRIFNQVSKLEWKVTKSSISHRAKIVEEFNWFRSMPSEIQQFLPRIFDDNIKEAFSDRAWYSLEQIRYPTLREWYLFLDSDVRLWNKIFDKLFDVLDEFYETNSMGEGFIAELFTKTVLRIEKLPEEFRDYDFLVNMEKVKTSLHDTIFHGDLVFSNIFYDDKTASLKLIDPNGRIQGNVLYDYAKLMTCVIYDYDFIDANLYTEKDGKYTFFNSGKQPIKDLFMEKLNEKFNPENVKMITLIAASLFLTMIPLHSESPTNQKLFYQCYKRALKDAT